jgi:hypothetical protein
MTYKPDAFFESLKVGTVGHRVSSWRLVRDILLIDVDAVPGDDKGVTFWFDPIWHVRGPDGVWLGSSQFTDLSAHDDDIDSLAAPLDILNGRAIKNVSIEPSTFDLTLAFDGGYCIKTFVSDVTVAESWHIRENLSGFSLEGSPRGIVTCPAKPSYR